MDTHRAEGRVERAIRQHGEVTTSHGYAKGMGDPRQIGLKIGYVYLADNRVFTQYAVEGDHREGVRQSQITRPVRCPIHSLGVVYWGNTPCLLGVAMGCTSIFIGKNGVVRRFPGVRLPAPAPYIRHLKPTAQKEFAEAVTRAWAEAVTPLPVRELTMDARKRYHELVLGHVRTRILDAARRGVTKTMDEFAKGVDVNWTARDLHDPRYPTVMHAILVSLVLGLEAGQAKYLIYFAALLEYRLPMMSETTAASIYAEAVRLLATLSPGWWAQSYLWDWSTGGTLDEVFRNQWCRMVMAAWGRDKPLHSMTDAPQPEGDAELDLRGADPSPMGEPPAFTPDAAVLLKVAVPDIDRDGNFAEDIEPDDEIEP